LNVMKFGMNDKSGDSLWSCPNIWKNHYHLW